MQYLGIYVVVMSFWILMLMFVLGKIYKKVVYKHKQFM